MASSEKQSEGLGSYLAVYVCVLAIAGLQFLIAYQQIDVSRKFIRMLLLAIVEAGLAVTFFMHMRSEQRNFVATLFIGLIFVLTMMNMIWWDSFRLLHFRLLQ